MKRAARVIDLLPRLRERAGRALHEPTGPVPQPARVVPLVVPVRRLRPRPPGGGDAA